MDLTHTAMVFADSRAGAPFVIALACGMLIACGFLLLRPWPPRLLRGAIFAFVVVTCGVALGYALLDRKVVVDPAAGRVISSARVLGLGPEQAWPFSSFDAVRVKYKPTRIPRETTSTRTHPARAQAEDRYAVEIDGGAGGVVLRSYEDPLEAERVARSVARLGGWPARRLGYELRSGNGRAGDGISTGDLQAFETPSGRRGIGMSIDAWVQVRIREGAESVIAPEPAE